MAKRTCQPPKEPPPAVSKARARIAFDAVVESIHDDHQVLEGMELYEAVIEVFGLTRPSTPPAAKK